MNRRLHELLHAVYAIPPSAFSTDAVNFKLYKVHAHYNELDAIYAFNFQPSQCLYYVIIRIIGAGVSLFKILRLMNGINIMRIIIYHNLTAPIMRIIITDSVLAIEFP